MRDWTKPPRLLWKKTCGGGYAAFCVVGKLAFTLEQRGDNESVVAYDADTGDEVWVRSWRAHFRDAMGGPGPRATPTFHDGDLFALGATGRLVCLEAATGKVKWQTDILTPDNQNIMWGMCGSPLVYDELVVVNPGAQTPAAKGRAVVAYERKTGKVVWRSGDTQAGYSSPQLSTLAGRRQVLVFDGDGAGGYDPADGHRLWFFPISNPTQKITVAQPLVIGDDRVFLSIGYGVGSVMVRVRRDGEEWSCEKLWGPTKAMGSKFGNPVAHGEHLYGLDEGILACLDQKTGQLAWPSKEGRYGHGQMLVAGDLLVILAEDGDLALVQATPEGHRELGRFHALDGAKTWNNPAIANGRAYVRNHEEMACYDLTRSGD